MVIADLRLKIEDSKLRSFRVERCYSPMDRPRPLGSSSGSHGLCLSYRGQLTLGREPASIIKRIDRGRRCLRGSE